MSPGVRACHSEIFRADSLGCSVQGTYSTGVSRRRAVGHGARVLREQGRNPALSRDRYARDQEQGSEDT